MIELRCQRLLFINRWWNAAGVLAIVQLVTGQIDVAFLAEL